MIVRPYRISSGPRVGLVNALAQRRGLECCRGGRNGMSQSRSDFGVSDLPALKPHRLRQLFQLPTICGRPQNESLQLETGTTLRQGETKKMTMTTGTPTSRVPSLVFHPAEDMTSGSGVGREFQRHAPVKSVPGWLTSASSSTLVGFGSAAWLPLPRINCLATPDGFVGGALRFSGHVTEMNLRSHPAF